jgi:hypothetical protein
MHSEDRLLTTGAEFVAIGPLELCTAPPFALSTQFAAQSMGTGYGRSG